MTSMREEGRARREARKESENPVAVEIRGMIKPLLKKIQYFSKVPRIHAGGPLGVVWLNRKTKRYPDGYKTLPAKDCSRGYFTVLDGRNELGYFPFDAKKPIPAQIAAPIRALIARMEAVVGKLERLQDKTDYEAIRKLVGGK